MSERNAIAAWNEHDAAFEEKFDQQQTFSIRRFLRGVLGKQQPVTLNGYRDHLLAGHAINALPVDGLPPDPHALEELMAEDFDAEVHAQHGLLQTPEARKSLLKLILDLRAGKISLMTHCITAPNQHFLKRTEEFTV